MLRAAWLTTLVSLLALLLLTSRSLVLLATTPWNSRLVPGITSEAMSTVTGSTTVSFGASAFVVVSVTVPSPLSAANQPPGRFALSNVAPGGSVSVTTVPSASLGPAFVTVAVTTAVVPAMLVGVLASTRERSAFVVTGVVSVIAVAPVSGVVAVMLALLARSPVWLDSTVPRIVTTTVAPAARSPTLHGSALQLPWLLVMLVAVKPVGSASLTTTPPATLGPALVTIIW
jgi:hypothetical protein